MKVNDFAKKYHVDYGTVYAATATIKPIRGEGMYEFDEAELIKAVRKSAQRRRENCVAALERVEMILDHVSTDEANRIVEKSL